MDQIKIGKFITNLRKEKNLTQNELAEKLGITDRAISKWENGRGLPEISLLKPLCDELGISVNELLSGERIEKENINTKVDENLINTLEDSKKKINKIKIILIAVLSVFLSLIICFTIDVSRMKNNLPVIFSTWGYCYTPPINLQDDLIELTVKEYIIAHDDSEPKHHYGEKAFVAFKTYLVEEIEKETKYNLYVWVVGKKCHLENGEIKNSTGYSIPHKFTVEKQEGVFAVVDSRIPRDGGYYSEDMKNIFPYWVRRDMNEFYNDGTYDRLNIEVDEQAKLYFHIN